MIIVSAIALSTGIAEAHISINSGPAAANKSQKITFGVGHGCTGQDTIAIRIVIPTGVTGVRALKSDFGWPTYERDVAGAVTAVSWRKPVAQLAADDVNYYEVTIRARTPDAPFTVLPFVVEQTCRNKMTGVETVVRWDDIEEEAPHLTIVPAKLGGWNKFTLGATTTITDEQLPVFFGDALIVWRGTAAYSSNAETALLIAATPGVSALSGGLQPNDVVWVRY
jgi:uncharacterized protein YcnI